LILAKRASGPVIEVLDGTSPAFELGDIEACGEFAAFPIQPFVIDEQTDKLRLAQALLSLAFEALLGQLGECEEFHGIELVKCLLKRRNSDPRLIDL
jgi:hypothetical protein